MDYVKRSLSTESEGSFISWKHCAIHEFADRWSAVGGEKKMANLIGMSQEGKVSRALLLQDKSLKHVLYGFLCIHAVYTLERKSYITYLMRNHHC